MKRTKSRVDEVLREIARRLKSNFKDNLQAIILYGSWAKGRAREDSDIDLLIIFEEDTSEFRKRTHEVIRDLDCGKEISIVVTSEKDFEQEKLPLFTAVKKEGSLLYGDMDLRVNPKPSAEKYKKFFEKSKECECGKVRMAKEFLKKGFLSSVILNCYIASKHAFQAGLAMKGIGFSSKFSILAEWVERYYGKEWREVFKKLYDLYVKSEYQMEELSKAENSLAIRYAEKILEKIYGESQN